MTDKKTERTGRIGLHLDSNEGTGPMLAAQSVASGDPLALLEREHALQLIFCERLEEIADRLPRRTDFNLVHSALRLLGEGMQPHMRLEEEAVFPILCRKASSDSALVEACRQSQKEHGEDAGLVLEIIDALEALETAGVARNPEMMGYMLRGYFTGQRRHIEWENAVILPAARKLFDVDDLARLRTWMIENDHQRFVDLLHLVISKRSVFGCE